MKKWQISPDVDCTEKVSGLKIYNFCFAVIFIFITCAICAVSAGEECLQRDEMSKERDVINQSIKCYESPEFLVIAKEVRGKAGTDFLIKYKSNPDEKIPCTYVSENNDFEIPNEWAEYFAGLKGNLLFLDSTTGPGPSGFTIWNLKKRKKVYEGTWSDPEEFKDESLVFWLETGDANDDNCPEIKEWKSHGLKGAIETKVILDLTDFKLSKTSEKRCSPRQ